MDIVLERILTLLPRKPDGTLVHGARTAFAKNIGAPSNIFAEWIAGRNNSYKNYLYQIAAKYNVSVEWLKGESEQKEKPTAQSDGLSVENIKLLLDKMSAAELVELMGDITDTLRKRGQNE